MIALYEMDLGMFNSFILIVSLFVTYTRWRQNYVVFFFNILRPILSEIAEKHVSFILLTNILNISRNLIFIKYCYVLHIVDHFTNVKNNLDVNGKV